MKSDFEMACHALRSWRGRDLTPEELRDIRHELGVNSVSMNRAYWRSKMEAAINEAEDLPELKKLMIAIVEKVA